MSRVPDNPMFHRYYCAAVVKGRITGLTRLFVRLSLTGNAESCGTPSIRRPI